MQSETQNEFKITKRKIGFFYENIAKKYLINNGYNIVDINIYTRYGEIDILGEKDGIYYIFEVKGGRNEEEILERFTKKKLIRLKKLYEYVRLKYDVIDVFVDALLIVTMEGTIKVVHIKNIF